MMKLMVGLRLVTTTNTGEQYNNNSSSGCNGSLEMPTLWRCSTNQLSRMLQLGTRNVGAAALDQYDVGVSSCRSS
jgi:hypothetical protein